MTKNEEFEKWDEENDKLNLPVPMRILAAWNARQPEIDALKDHNKRLAFHNKNLQAEVERLRADAERFAILLREFMYCEVQSTEEIEEGSELIKKYRVMKETK
jgi:hypothetical protein